jgi:uncharacterized protein YjbI with pentapeptide repeats
VSEKKGQEPYRRIDDEELKEILGEYEYYKKTDSKEGKELPHLLITSEQLKQVEEQHTMWLETGSQDGEQAVLRCADLAGLDLKQVLLPRAKLEGSNLAGANMRGARLSGTDLLQTDLRGADLRGADLREANLEGANMGGADLRGARLGGTDLSRTDLSGSDLRGAGLRGADLRKIKLRGADLRKANLREANLQSANLREANLQRANLREANLREANLRTANLQKAHLSSADLREARLMGADLLEARLSKVKLRGANLKGADLREARLTEADLREAFMFRVDLRDAFLFKADLREADLKGAKMRGASMHQAKLQGANLGGANLIEADLSHAAFKAEPAPASGRGPELSGKEEQETDGQKVENQKEKVSPNKLFTLDALNLHARQMAGADVSNAGLPDRVWNGLEDGVSNVAEASKKADKLFVGLLAGCVFIFMVLATAKQGETVELPIFKTKIPQSFFYWAVPAGLVAVFFYFQLYLQRLWERLAELPAVFEDGTPLDKKVAPWLPLGYVRAHLKRLRNHKRPYLYHWQTLVIQLLVWWLAPLTLSLIWVRYLLAGPVWWVCTLQIAAALTGIFIALEFLYRARRTLRLGVFSDPDEKHSRWEKAGMYFMQRTGQIVLLSLFGVFMVSFSISALIGP